MGEILVFKCNDCGRVAEDFKWPKQKEEQKHPAAAGFSPPICPECDSMDIDLDHDVIEEE